MNKYRIVKLTYTDEYGKSGITQYYIKKLKTFLGIKYWSNVKHQTGEWITTTYFYSYEDACKFIDSLNEGRQPNTWSSEVVREICI